MKKILVLLVTLFLFTGCSNITDKNEDEENTDLQIVGALTSIGEVDETLDKQKLNYEFTISNEENISIIGDSIEVILTDWVSGKLIENEITEKRFNEDHIKVKGYVIFDSKDLTKEGILENEPFISGIKLKTKNSEEIFIRYKFN